MNFRMILLKLCALAAIVFVFVAPTVIAKNDCKPYCGNKPTLVPTTVPTIPPTIPPTEPPTIPPTEPPTIPPTEPPTPTPLIISNVYADTITQTSAKIHWSLSDYATGQVEYGTTISYGLFSTPENTYNWNYHIQVLYNLIPNTLYHYRVKSTAQNGQSAISGDYTFTTLPTPIPTIVPPPTVPPGTYYVPISINSTGTVDVTTELQAFLNSVADGSTINFTSGTTYLVTELIFTSRNNLTLIGNGSTIKGTVKFYTSNNITVRNLRSLLYYEDSKGLVISEPYYNPPLYYTQFQNCDIVSYGG